VTGEWMDTDKWRGGRAGVRAAAGGGRRRGRRRDSTARVFASIPYTTPYQQPACLIKSEKI